MEGMRALLRGSLGKSLSTLSPLDRLAAAWPVACGRVLASRGELLAFDDGKLTIKVTDAAWLDEMRAMRQRLAGELARIAAVDLREIHFEGVNERPKKATGLSAAGARDTAVGRATKPKPGTAAKTPRSPRRPPRSEG